MLYCLCQLYTSRIIKMHVHMNTFYIYWFFPSSICYNSQYKQNIILQLLQKVKRHPHMYLIFVYFDYKRS